MRNLYCGFEKRGRSIIHDGEMMVRGLVSITLNLIAIVLCGGVGALAGRRVVAALVSAIARIARFR